MHMFSSTLFLTLVASATLAQEAIQHSGCYDYFLKKDNCVHSAGVKEDRCKVNGKRQLKRSIESTGFVGSARLVGRSNEHHDLVRRYDTTQPTLDSVAENKPEAICPDQTFDESKPGACLWLGTSNDDIAQSGWMNKVFTANCNKNLYIQKKDDTSVTAYAPLLGACPLGAKTFDMGCFQIGITKATFDTLQPNATEVSAGQIAKIIWDFDNLYGNKSQNAVY